MPEAHADEVEAMQYMRGVREQITNRLRKWMAAVDKSSPGASCELEWRQA